jgi:hypothetical protein
LISGFSLTGLVTPFLQKAPDLSAKAEKELAEKELYVEAEKLRTEIKNLEKELYDRAEQCPPEAVPSVMEAGPEPGPEVVPEQEKETLIIPGKPLDMNFLSGRWLCDRGLYNKSDRQPLILIYEFDSNGKGTTTVRQKGREDCVSSAVASMDAQGVLVIEVERQICPDGRSYSAETIECKGNEANRAMCHGKSERGTEWGENVPFYKID